MGIKMETIKDVEILQELFSNLTMAFNCVAGNYYEILSNGSMLNDNTMRNHISIQNLYIKMVSTRLTNITDSHVNVFWSLYFLTCQGILIYHFALK